MEELGTILGVWAHPDDEAYLSAGIMAAARDAGSRVVVLTATLGEQGTPDPVSLPPSRLAEIRRAELSRSLEVLRVSDHRTLGYADGSCDDEPVLVAARHVAEVIEEVEPDTILTFGPDGYTGHPDHRAVSAWVDSAVASTGVAALVLHAAADARFMAEFADVHDAYDVFFAGRPPMTDVTDLAIRLALRGRDLDRKVAALAAQTSQTAGLIAELGDRFRDWVAVERFVESAGVRDALVGR